MVFIDFAQVADTPTEQTTPTHIAREWELAKNENVNVIKREMFIDRLATIGDQDTVTKLLALYKSTNNQEIKSRIILGLQSAYQTQRDRISNYELEQLREFYANQLNKKLRDIDIDKIVRGYVDLHSINDIESSLDTINTQLKQVELTLKLGIQLQLSHRSKALESIYIPLIIKELKEAQSSSLDDMFFTIASMGANSFSPDSVKQIKSYIDYRATKYNKTLAPNSLGPNNDAYFGVAKHAYDDAVKAFK